MGGEETFEEGRKEISGDWWEDGREGRKGQRGRYQGSLSLGT